MTLLQSPDGMLMQAVTFLRAYTSICIVLLTILYKLRTLFLPKPLAGIPYDAESARRFLGDLPALARAANSREWAINHGRKLKSPLFQVFLRPFAKPLVYVTDFYEMADISMRRTGEFDKSDQVISVLEGVVPEQLLTLRSHDPRYKRNKELVRDLMSPTFLHKVT
jgi:hypothetical protein